ncbi:E3 ubiquitin-protein ligase TRIM37-like isoform X2 [Pieris rapae]|uniref:E3 ubiquitin-protein ligase TRIM37-like isoform X2 n=1 Tax=Pieris rapae TaxID=64459 RepID=UPI001E27FC5F|nr:E3 ubiquitin-protein ligase TRIM37-like isoform X2 [Pieris rapae]
MSSRADKANGEEEIVKTLLEAFRCFICIDKIVDAHLCPHCSNLFCYVCVRRWLTGGSSQCPHCRAALRLHELINCRWMGEITKKIETMQQANSSAQRESFRDRCSTHQERLTVYCCTCSQCICHECALWGGKHSGHTFKPLEEVYEQHVTQIRDGVSQLKQRLMELKSLAQEGERNVESVRAAKDERVREMRQAVELIYSRLDSAFGAKILTLMEQKNCLTQETEQLEHLLQEVEHKLDASTKCELIAKSGEMSETIHQLSIKPMASIVTAPVPADFHSEIVPSYDSSTFTLTKFTKLRDAARPVISDPLYVYGLCWRLVVDPDGFGGNQGRYLSVGLKLMAGLPENSTYECRFEMLHQESEDPSKNFVTELTSVFEVGKCCRVKKFFRLDLLASDGYLNQETDTLILRFQVRPPTFYQRCRDQQWYINKLMDEHDLQIIDLKERLNAEMCRNLKAKTTASNGDWLKKKPWPVEDYLTASTPKTEASEGCAGAMCTSFSSPESHSDALPATASDNTEPSNGTGRTRRGQFCWRKGFQKVVTPASQFNEERVIFKHCKLLPITEKRLNAEMSSNSKAETTASNGDWLKKKPWPVEDYLTASTPITEASEGCAGAMCTSFSSPESHSDAPPDTVPENPESSSGTRLPGWRRCILQRTRLGQFCWRDSFQKVVTPTSQLNEEIIEDNKKLTITEKRLNAEMSRNSKAETTASNGDWLKKKPWPVEDYLTASTPITEASEGCAGAMCTSFSSPESHSDALPATASDNTEPSNGAGRTRRGQFCWRKGFQKVVTPASQFNEERRLNAEMSPNSKAETTASNGDWLKKKPWPVEDYLTTSTPITEASEGCVGAMCTSFSSPESHSDALPATASDNTEPSNGTGDSLSDKLMNFSLSLDGTSDEEALPVQPCSLFRELPFYFGGM